MRLLRNILLGLGAAYLVAKGYTAIAQQESEKPVAQTAQTASSGYSLQAYPSNAGMATEIFAHCLGSPKRIVLREDGKPIAESNATYLEKVISKDNPGEHVYVAEFFSEKADARTAEIAVSFTGKPMDFLPEISSVTVFPIVPFNLQGNSASIRVSARDGGDIKGLKQVIFSEGDRILKTEADTWLYAECILENITAGNHTYLVTVEDRTGNRVRSDPITIAFSGKPYPPEIKNFFATYTTVGRACELRIITDDPLNRGPKQGIEEVLVYEDGQPIKKDDDKWSTTGEEEFIVERQHNTPGTHTYWATVTNRNGRSAESSKVSVDFTGNFLPPHVDFNVRYDQTKGHASVFVDANDNKNVADASGIKSIVVFEDGKPLVKKDQDNWLVHHAARPKGEQHTYHAEITNKFGVTVETPKQTVTFE